MPRCFALLLLLSLVGSCTSPNPVVRRAVPQAGDPALDGADYLLSESDFRAILAVSGLWLARTHPSFHVRRVHVVAPNRVEVYLRGRLATYYSEDSDLHCIELQRSNNGWRVIADNLSRVPTIDPA